MLLEVWLLGPEQIESFVVDVLEHGALANLLDDGVVKGQEELVVVLLRLLGVDEVRAGDDGAVGAVAEAEAGDDDARVQIVIIRLRVELEVVAAATLDDGPVRPIELDRVKVEVVFFAAVALLATFLKKAASSILPSTLDDRAACVTFFSASRMSDISSTKKGFRMATQALDAVRIARWRESAKTSRGCLVKSTHQLVLVLDGQGRHRQGWSNVDLLERRGDGAKGGLPFVDDRPSRVILGDAPYFFLSRDQQMRMHSSVPHTPEDLMTSIIC